MPPTVILIRHAEAMHMILITQELATYLQNELPLAREIELIVASPMRRTLQTVEQSLGWLIKLGVPVVLLAELQENSAKPCDTGRPIPTMKEEWPQFNWDDVDPVYPSKTGLYKFSKEAIARRGIAARAWLRQWPEKVIAVVGHSGFLRVGMSYRKYFNADFRIFDFEVGDEDIGGKLVDLKGHTRRLETEISAFWPSDVRKVLSAALRLLGVHRMSFTCVARLAPSSVNPKLHISDLKFEMAEILGVVSSVAGLLSLTIQILDASLAYYTSAKEASKSMSQLLKELISIKGVLSNIQDIIVTNPSISTAYKTIPSSSVLSHLVLELAEHNFSNPSPGILDECHQCLNGLLSTIQKGLNRNQKPTVLRRLTWPFTEKEVQKEVFRKEYNEWHAKTSERKILEWLSPLTFEDKHSDIASKRQPGTAGWVLQSTSFRTWMEGKSSSDKTIWCPGDPRVGKTTTASLVIDYLLNIQQTDDIGVAYVYCDFHNEMNLTLNAILGSLTRQLVQNSNRHEFPNELRMEFVRSRDGLSTLKFEEHINLFRTIAAKIPSCYVIIDALDELENRQNSTRRALLAALREIEARKLDIVAREEDIERFLRAKISEDRELQELLEEDSNLEDRVIKTILAKANHQKATT
ncbi:hypothetical protein G7Y89_g12415 [Cudoniella acicularis]|uniref:Nephrocystin 3-like N-terminal domain-containing protein n=1 Tax=Cudoniella acicularis TaxID=354080 RepID=A0A8H4RA46_9HELO|nr:hypothetical protein G7Y89_g12415 [Cudoniella acicularis]